MHLSSNAATSFEIHQGSVQSSENTFQDDLFQMHEPFPLYSTELCHAFQFSKPIDLAIFMRWPGILSESGREKERPQAVKVQECLCKSDATSNSEFSKISCLPAASRSCLRKSVEFPIDSWTITPSNHISVDHIWSYWILEVRQKTLWQKTINRSPKDCPVFPWSPWSRSLHCPDTGHTMTKTRHHAENNGGLKWIFRKHGSDIFRIGLQYALQALINRRMFHTERTGRICQRIQAWHPGQSSDEELTQRMRSRHTAPWHRWSKGKSEARKTVEQWTASHLYITLNHTKSHWITLNHTESHWITHKWYMFWDPLHMSNSPWGEAAGNAWQCFPHEQWGFWLRKPFLPVQNGIQILIKCLEMPWNRNRFPPFPPWNDTDMLWLVLTMLWLVNLGWWFVIFHDGPDSWWVLPFCDLLWKLHHCWYGIPLRHSWTPANRDRPQNELWLMVRGISWYHLFVQFSYQLSVDFSWFPPLT